MYTEPIFIQQASIFECKQEKIKIHGNNYSLKHEFDIPPVAQIENESSASANVNLVEENENHMVTVVESRSERVDEESIYFINADESTDISRAINQQNIEGLTGDLCIINYQE